MRPTDVKVCWPLSKKRKRHDTIRCSVSKNKATTNNCPYGFTSEGSGKAGTLSNVEARKWYLEQEAKIAGQIDKSLSLEQQAKQAFELRNQYRTEARELMADRKLAEQLNVSDPNRT